MANVALEDSEYFAEQVRIVVGQGLNTVNVARLATGGLGTYASPYTGWEAAATALHAPDMTFLFPSGVYASTGAFNFAFYAHCRFLGEAGTILLYTGSAGGKVMLLESDHATTNVDGEYGEHEATYGLTIENFILDGDSLADYGFWLHSVHHSNFKNIYVRNVVDTKFYWEFAILNVSENLRATRRVGDYTSEAPEDLNCQTGFYFTNEPGQPINTVQECTFINTVAEFCDDFAFYLTDGANQNKFIGGAGQASGINLQCNGNGNSFFMDCEYANSGVDYQINGKYNVLNNCLSTTGLRIGNDTTGAVPVGNEIRGGQYHDIDIHPNAVYTLVDKPGYNLLSTTGRFVNRSASTIILGAPHEIGSTNRYGAGFVMPDKSYFKDTLEIAQGKGFVIPSPDGSLWEFKPDNTGALVGTAFTGNTVSAKSDNFNDNSIGAQWHKGTFKPSPSAAVTVAESSNTVRITLPNSTYDPSGNNYLGLVNTPHEIADGGYERIKVVSYPTTGNFQTRFQIGKTGQNCLIIFRDGSDLYFGQFSGGSFGSIASVTFNAVNHLYWRFRRSGANVVGETSPDGSTWTTLGTSTGTPFEFTNYQTCIEAGATGSSTFDAPIVFDDYVFVYG